MRVCVPQAWAQRCGLLRVLVAVGGGQAPTPADPSSLEPLLLPLLAHRHLRGCEGTRLHALTGCSVVTFL